MKSFVIFYICATALLTTLNPKRAHADQSACQLVYAAATRNISVSSQKAMANESYFDLYCEKSGAVRSAMLDTGISFPIKGIPINVSASGSWDQQEMKNFCKIGAENKFYRKDTYEFGSTVVTEALSSFNDCVALNNKSLIVTHKENRPSGVTINARRTNTSDRISVNGFNFSEDHVYCTTRSFSADGIEEPVINDKSFIVEGNFAITCKRLPIKINGENHYPRTSMTLSTTDGSYNVVLEADSNVGFNLASQAAKNYTDSLAAQTAALSRAKKAVAFANRVQPTSHHMVHFGPGNQFVHLISHYFACPVWTEAERLKLVNAKAIEICGSDRASEIAKSWELNDSVCGNHLYKFVCMPKI